MPVASEFELGNTGYEAVTPLNKLNSHNTTLLRLQDRRSGATAQSARHGSPAKDQ